MKTPLHHAPTESRPPRFDLIVKTPDQVILLAHDEKSKLSLNLNRAEAGDLARALEAAVHEMDHGVLKNDGTLAPPAAAHA